MIDFIINVPIVESVIDAVTAANKAIAGRAELGEICVTMAIVDAGPNKTFRHIILGFEKTTPYPKSDIKGLLAALERSIAFDAAANAAFLGTESKAPKGEKG